MERDTTPSYTAEAPIASRRTGEDAARPSVAFVSISLSRKEQGALYMKALKQADRIKELNATNAELTATGQRFADLFEAFIRAGDDLVPEALRATTENDVVSAMYEFRGALSKVQQQPDCAREPGALTQPAISPAPSWISVADRLPGDSSDVIAYCEDTGEQFVGFHIGGGEFQFAVDHRGQEIVCTPTHWMPCPAAPVGSADSQKGGA
jgi:hypothetical protein